MRIKKVLFIGLIVVLIFQLGRTQNNLPSYLAKQGETLILNLADLTDTPSKDGFKINVFGKNYDLVEINGKISAIIGIDFMEKSGDYELLVFKNGKIEARAKLVVLKNDFKTVNFGVSRGKTKPNLKEKIQKEEAMIWGAICGEKREEFSLNQNFGYPLDKNVISCEAGDFGIYRKWRNGYVSRHRGVDLRAPYVPVKAIGDGVVVLTGNFVLEGKFVVIYHGADIYSLYFHLSKISVKKGQIVKKGETVGISGDTGFAEGPHLHFVVKINCKTVDPLKFIEKMTK